MKHRNKITLFIFLAFFIVGLFTLPHYGINWDTINHLPRGQAYLNYFLTGKRDYSNLPRYEDYWQQPDTLFIDADREINYRSLYQNDSVSYNWYLEYDGNGHPPTSDILSSGFNYVLFQKLHLINDIDAYRVYGIFLAAILVGLVFWWVSEVTGMFAGMVAAASLALYPLFWSESHFNTEKDIPETVYWSLLLFAVWRGVTQKSWKWILVSGVFFGLALGTKFNVVFSVFIIVPWLIYYLIRTNYKNKVTRKSITNNKKLILSVAAAPIIGLAIFILAWPYLWGDIIGNLATVVEFYKIIGLTENVDIRFVGLLGMNTYPTIWITYTTPIVILLLALAGVIWSVFQTKDDKRSFYVLILLWLFVPIARVMMPGANIYGGVRQIMEYIPAMAMLAGIGAFGIRKIVTGKFNAPKSVVSAVLLLAFVPITLKLISIHPNENVYFNQIAGGLSGAREKQLPAWGNSFGAAYRQGVNWLNENAEEDANVVYAHELIPNIPRNQLREDFVLWNVNRSGYLNAGEYAITLTYDGTRNRSYYDTYLEKFIDPSYEVVVDGVPILKVWHNTKENLKYDPEEALISDVDWEETDEGIQFDLGNIYSLSRMEFVFDEHDCDELEYSHVRISSNGENWTRLPGNFPSDWIIPKVGKQPNEGKFIEPFTGQKARYVEFVIFPTDACMRKVDSSEIYYFIDPPTQLFEW